MKSSDRSLRLRLGPLCYELRAADSWGRSVLARIDRHLECVSFIRRPHRVIYLLRHSLSPSDLSRHNPGPLPDWLDHLALDSVRDSGWTMLDDSKGSFYLTHVSDRRVFIVRDERHMHYRLDFLVPWEVLLPDIVRSGGAIMHGGLAYYLNRSFVLTAPPGGGKTTALSRIPSPWECLADDCCLVWPSGRQGYRASPMPTWSFLLGRRQSTTGLKRWQVGRSVRLELIALLVKSPRDDCRQASPAESLEHIYRSLCEYPAVLPRLREFRVCLFRTATNLSQVIPIVTLELTLIGKFWESLANWTSSGQTDTPPSADRR